MGFIAKVVKDIVDSRATPTDGLARWSCFGVPAHSLGEWNPLWPHWLQVINDGDTLLWGRIQQTKARLTHSRCSAKVCFKNWIALRVAW